MSGVRLAVIPSLCARPHFEITVPRHRATAYLYVRTELFYRGFSKKYRTRTWQAAGRSAVL